MDHFAEQFFSRLPSPVPIKIGVPNCTTLSHNSSLNSSTSAFSSTFLLNSIKNFYYPSLPNVSRKVVLLPSKVFFFLFFHYSRTPTMPMSVHRLTPKLQLRGDPDFSVEIPKIASRYPPTLPHSSPGAILSWCQDCNSLAQFLPLESPRCQNLLQAR